MKKVVQSYNTSWTFYIVFVIIFIFLLYFGVDRNEGGTGYRKSRRKNMYNALKYLTSKENK